MYHKVLAYRYDFQEMYFTKDVFLVPYYMGRELKMPVEYIYTQNLGNTTLPTEYRGAKIICTKGRNEFLNLLRYVVLQSLVIDVLFFNGSSAVHMFAVWFYKHINKHGKVVIFGDMEKPLAEEFSSNEFHYSSGISGWIKDRLVNYFFNNVTYIVANTEAYKIMDDLCKRKHWKGLLHFYPCLDDEMFHEYGMARKSWNEKEKIMVCVGRIGNHQKNTEMLLEALKNVDLKDWKIYMIGPVTSSFDLKEEGDFQRKIDAFLEEYPQNKDKLIFTGMIYDQKVLFDYYNRAKVLLSTARHEGFANVYSQAAAFGCYIVSTDVGGADVCSNNWRYGTKLKQEDSDYLTYALIQIVNGDADMNDLNSLSFADMSYSERVRNVLLPRL